ncbi:SCO family protein [Fundidesulfovibrio soli]|uniref:SCO family protein n=1 Tax=Fundidesulfovibrio soli TaxID=2922716 RepID=UPI001FAFCC64|nr:SCO family protein [Fundidesulfovibrio soli]
MYSGLTTPGPRGLAGRAGLPFLAAVLLLAGLMLSARPSPAHQDEAADHQHDGGGAALPSAVGVQEKLGQTIPDDIVMRDETGREVNVKELLKTPTILVPVYYSCPNDCNLLLGSLAQVLPLVSLEPGKDFQVVSVSFDEHDTPQVAARRKNDFITAMGDRFPARYWTFLTGDKANIRRLTDAVGFGFQRDGKAFKHPVVLVALSPSGKVVRYLYGVTPLPFDITMAATEAARETVGLSVRRAIAMCYTYDPQGRQYVFDLMKVSGAGILAAMALFGVFLYFGGRKKK